MNVSPGLPPVYKLRDIKGEILGSTFYEAELQKVRITPDSVFRIEKILDKKIKNGFSPLAGLAPPV